MSGGERGRLRAPSRRVDSGAHQALLLVHESDGSWTVHGLEAGGRLEAEVMVALCQAVLYRARGGVVREPPPPCSCETTVEHGCLDRSCPGRGGAAEAARRGARGDLVPAVLR